MTARAAILAAVAFTISTSPAQGRFTTQLAAATRVPLFSRTLAFQLPHGFALANNRRNATHVLMEYIPSDESLTTWTRMVTVQAYRGLGASSETSADIAHRAFYPARCSTGPDYRNNGERQVAIGLRRSVISVTCGSLPAGAYPLAKAGAGEQDFILMFRDSTTIYTLNYAQRGVPFTNNVPPRRPDEAETVLGLVFGDISLCLTRGRCGGR